MVVAQATTSTAAAGRGSRRGGGGAGTGLGELPGEMVGSGVGRTRRAYVPRPNGAGCVPPKPAPNFDLRETSGAGLREVTSGLCALAQRGLTCPLSPMLEIELGVPPQAPPAPFLPPAALPRRRLRMSPTCFGGGLAQDKPSHLGRPSLGRRGALEYHASPPRVSIRSFPEKQIGYVFRV